MTGKIVVDESPGAEQRIRADLLPSLPYVLPCGSSLNPRDMKAESECLAWEQRGCCLQGGLMCLGVSSRSRLVSAHLSAWVWGVALPAIGRRTREQPPDPVPGGP